MNPFDNKKLYSPNELGEIASAGQLAKLRHFRKGPAYVKLSGSIRYSGADLNAWIVSCRTDPSELTAA
ncbi:MAG: MerR family transcriptional regulator [Alphaproteobacteria bacterium]|nr:MerR family transcriptional regulator [Alphaproteobacteria bacterium]